MDDNSLFSQVPEVVWDCGSPSPTAWKRRQGKSLQALDTEANSGISSSNISEQLYNRKVKECGNTSRKSHPIFKINAETLDKVRNIIGQLKSCGQAPSSSLEMLFERSGSNEELASAAVGLQLANDKQPDVPESLPPDFFNDDIFNESIVEPACDDKSGLDHSDLGISRAKSSTPSRCQNDSFSLNSKRKTLKRRSKLIPTESTPLKEKRQSCTVSPSATKRDDGVQPLNQDSALKRNNCQAFDSCVDVLVTFSPRNKQTPNSENVRAVSDSVKTSLLPITNKPLNGRLNRVNDSKSSNRVGYQSKSKLDNISISEELFSQLVKDDSWTLKCTAGAPPQPPLQDDISIDKSILTQFLMDDDGWTESCTRKPQLKQVVLKTATVKKDCFVPCAKPLNPVECNQLSDSCSKVSRIELKESDQTLPVTPYVCISTSVTKPTYSVTACNPPLVSKPNFSRPQICEASSAVSKPKPISVSSTTHSFRVPDFCSSKASSNSSSVSNYTIQNTRTTYSSSTVFQASLGNQNNQNCNILPMKCDQVFVSKSNLRNSDELFAATGNQTRFSRSSFQNISNQHIHSRSDRKYNFKTKSSSPRAIYRASSAILAPNSPTLEILKPTKIQPVPINEKDVCGKADQPLTTAKPKFDFRPNFLTSTRPFQTNTVGSLLPRMSQTKQSSSDAIHKCTAAEIEQKRLQALQRKRQRTRF